MDEHRVVGQRLPRRDGQIKATGEAKYAADHSLPGMLYGKVVRSPIPHGKILNIDASQALRLRGVKAVVTGRDFPGVKYGFLPHTRDKLPLETERVRFIGDEVAAVAAVDEDTAEEALGLIKVEYEPLEPVFDPFAAMEEGAPQLHSHVKKNISAQSHMNFGDVQAALREADVVREDRFVTQPAIHGFLEPHAVVANWESTGKVTLWASKQSPYITWRHMARGLGLDPSRIRFVQPVVGGGFGGKHEPMALDFAAVGLSRKAGRPVKIVYDQEEVVVSGRRRHAITIDLTMGAKRSGEIVAIECRAVADGGAYASVGALSIYIPGSMLTLPLRAPNFKYDGYRIYTNKPAAGAQRGHCMPQIRFAIEQLLDMVAEDLGIDPVDIRLINAVQPGEELVNGIRVTSCALSGTIRRAAEMVGWKKELPDPAAKETVVRGTGMACTSGVSGSRLGGHDSSTVVVKVQEDGRVTLMTGATDVGQGSDTVQAQMLAEELGLRMEDIDVATIDSEVTPLDPGVFAGRVTFASGNAVRAAAADLKRQLFAAAANAMEANPEDLEIADHRVQVCGSPDRGISWLEAVRAADFGQGSPIVAKGSATAGLEMVDFVTGYGNQSPAYSFGTMVAEAEIDTETGVVRMSKFLAVHDCGRAINPLLVEGQLEGCIVAGAGQALLEDLPMEDGLTLLSASCQYAMPTALDIPDTILTDHIDSIDPNGPFGAKEAAEAAQVSTLGAVANAVYRATGLRIKELPLSPDRVLAALEAKRKTSVSGGKADVV